MAALLSIQKSKGRGPPPWLRKFPHSPSFLKIEKAAKLSRPARVFELAERLGFNLSYSFASDRELLSDFFQCVVGVHADAEAHPQHAPTRGRGGSTTGAPAR